MIIPANKKRFPIVFFVGVIVSILLILLIVDAVRHLNDRGYGNSLSLGLCIGLSVWVLYFTVAAFLDYLKATFDRNAVLTITDSGINDNLSIFSVGNIRWTDITNIKIVTAYKTNLLVIEVIDPQSFINRIIKLKQRPLKSFLKKFGSPIVISQKRIDFDLTDLKEILIKTKTK